MISASALLSELRSAGLRIRAAGESLFVGPEELLTPALRDAIRQHKPALLDLLEADDPRQAAIDAYHLDNPPAFADGPVELRQVALVEMEPGKWVALDPAFLAWTKAHNAKAKAKWLKEHPYER